MLASLNVVMDDVAAIVRYEAMLLCERDPKARRRIREIEYLHLMNIRDVITELMDRHEVADEFRMSMGDVPGLQKLISGARLALPEAQSEE